MPLHYRLCKVLLVIAEGFCCTPCSCRYFSFHQILDRTDGLDSPGPAAQGKLSCLVQNLKSEQRIGMPSYEIIKRLDFLKNWTALYLQNLSPTKKWLEKNPYKIKEGMVLFIKDENKMKDLWRKGIVTKVIRSKTDQMPRTIQFKQCTLLSLTVKYLINVHV